MSTPLTPAEAVRYLRNIGYIFQPEMAATCAHLRDIADVIERLVKERDEALEGSREINEQLGTALDEIKKLKTERDGWAHSSECWELMHAKRHEELEQARKQCDDYRKEAEVSNLYIQKLARLLECSDGDDTPEMRIAALKTELAQARELDSRLDALLIQWQQEHKELMTERKEAIAQKDDDGRAQCSLEAMNLEICIDQLKEARQAPIPEPVSPPDAS